MWSFSTLQRPTQEEKERKRRFREEQKRQQKSRIARAKTFRHLEDKYNSGYFNYNSNNEVSLMDALRYRAKSASRAERGGTNEDYYGYSSGNRTINPRRREQSAGRVNNGMRFSNENSDYR